MVALSNPYPPFVVEDALVNTPHYRELHNTTEYPLSFVVFQNTNFVVVILDSLFKTGKSGTQLYCVIPGT